MKRWRPVSLAILAVACFWAVGGLHRYLHVRRQAFQAPIAGEMQNAPPLVTFTTVALGGFRGLIADALWVRASRLQDEGRFIEIVQLADWITKLEPRFTEVWAFHAWNMAYNISVLFPDPEDRWRWVQNGIRLLRDEGVVYNPGDPLLYRELGWLYQHKIGGRWDTAAMFYRRQLVREMAALFPGPRPDYSRLRSDPAAAERMHRVGRLDPATMEAVERDIGSLDWRTPEAHAIYWAWQGRRVSGGKSVECDRMIYQSLAGLFHQGRLYLGPDNDLWLMLPDPAMFEPTVRACEDAMRRHNASGIRHAFGNFLKEAILIFHSLGEPEKAAHAHRVLKRVFPDEPSVGVDDFVHNESAEKAGSQPAAETVLMVEDVFVQAYIWSVIGEPRRAAALDAFGRSLLKTLIDVQPGQRQTIPSVEDIRNRAWNRTMIELPVPLQERLRAMSAEATQNG